MIAPKPYILALAISVAAIASPAFAASHTHPGYNARAQAIDPAGSEGVSPHRADALRECSTQAGKLLEKDWGVRQSDVYGACMAEHGEQQ